MKKRILSILLAAIMVISLLPVTAFAVTPMPADYRGTWTGTSEAGDFTFVIGETSGTFTGGSYDNLELTLTMNTDAYFEFSCDEGEINFFSSIGYTLNNVLIVLNDFEAVDDVTMTKYVPPTYTITNGAELLDKETNHGYIVVNDKAAEGDTVTVAIRANEGYALKTLKYNDGTEDHNIVKDAQGAYKFTMPAKAVTVTATFEAEPIEVTAIDWSYDDTYHDVYVNSEDTKYIFELTEDLVYGKTYTYANMNSNWVCTLDEVGSPLVTATDATLTVTKGENDKIHIDATMTLGGNVYTITYDEQSSITITGTLGVNDLISSNKVVIYYSYDVEGYYLFRVTSANALSVTGTYTWGATSNGINDSNSYYSFGTTDRNYFVGGEFTVTGTPGNYTLTGFMVGTDGARYEITLTSPKTMPYSFDFETNPFSNGWRSIDADGDHYGWDTDTAAEWSKNLGINGGHCAVSMSYGGTTGARQANNWMFSPAITIPEDGATVSWYEQSQSPSYHDSYTVYVSETNTSTDPSGMTQLYSGAAANPWTQKTVNLSAKDYGGKTVYIAFRHNDSDKYALDIDNFAVETLITYTYEVSFPEGPEQVYISGKENSWTFTPMTMTSDTTATITLDTPFTEYKYTAGADWAYVEKNAQGGEITNRTAYANPDVVGSWMAVPVLPTETVADWTALQSAITAATEPTILQLTADLKAPDEATDGITIPNGKNITLDLNGKVINANGGAFSVITVDKGGKLTLIDSAPTTEHYFTVNADGLWTLTDNQTETTKTVTGGVITGGTGEFCGESWGTNGGGVCVCGTLNMKAGNIVGNFATDGKNAQGQSVNGFGGGVYVKEDGAFTMSDGTITGNTADAAGVSVYKSTFTMSGGTISDNIGYFGGGVCEQGGTFTMTGGTITGNTAAAGAGGGVYSVSGKVILDGTAKITGNEAAYGGGVYNAGGCTFIMNGGTISNNNALMDTNGFGGGVYNSGTFTMNDGTVSGNVSDGSGGGVYNVGTFTLTGGNIVGNTALTGGGIINLNTLKLLAAAGKTITINNNTAMMTGGVLNYDGTMLLSGTVNIKDNTCSLEGYYPANLATTTAIIIDGALTDSVIYVGHINDETGHDAGVLTSGFSTKNPNAKVGDFFYFDGSSTYYMALESGELTAKEVPANSYAISIPATVGGVVTADKQIAANGETVTLTVTSDEGYQLKSLTVSDADGAITVSQDNKFTMRLKPVTITAVFEAEGTSGGGKVKYIGADGKEAEATATKLTSDSKEWSGTVYITENTTIDDTVTLTDDTTLILADGATLTVKKGITGGKNLTVYGQTAGTGKLVVTGVNGASGSVGGDGITANVTVYSGEVQVTGGNGGGGNDEAGMGGNGISGNLTVSGSGTANVTGGNAGYRQYEGGTSNGGYGVSGTVTVSGNGKATVTGGNGCDAGYETPGFGGIGCLNLTVSGSGTANVTGGNGGVGGDNASVGGYGVMSGISVSDNGTAIIKGGNGGNGGGFGTSGNITVTDQGSATISGGNATVSGKKGANAYYTNITINGKVTGTNEPNDQTGGSVTITAAGDTPSGNVLYSFDFETDPFSEANGWKNIDADGDTHKWNWLETNGSMQSVSWSSSTSDLYPDNWLISPQISIPADGAEITWDVKSGSTSYPDHYGVYLCSKAEKPSNPDDLAANYIQIYEGQSPTSSGGSFVNLSVIVPAEYCGNSYYIAFRHYDSGDKWSFEIDNFTVKKPGASVVTTWSALQDAIDAADGDATTPATETTTIKLADDLKAPETGGATITIPAGKDITLDLNGKVLNANGGAFSAITVEALGKLTLTDSAPATEHKGYVDADGLWHLGEIPQGAEGTEKTVTGGIITGGTGKPMGGAKGSNGGGVTVYGTFNMNAGNVVGNKAVTGVSDTGKAANGFCGGVYIQGGGAFTMAGGAITGNTARMGGGVFNRGTFTMSGGTVSDNEATYGGGVFNDGTFTMSGGTVSDNEATYGGGVYNNSDGTFTMTNGEISGNEATYGGGVYNCDTFTMSDGTISGNTATYGGGIQNSSSATLKLTAGEGKTIKITGNTATSAEGGVANWGEMHLSGAVIIKENICKNTYDDGVNYPIDLATGTPVIIDGDITGSEIHITHANSNNDEHDSGALFTGFAENNPDAKLSDFFTYNGPSGFYTLVNDDGDWEMGKANGASLPTVEVDDGAIMSDGEPVEVKDTDGGDVASEYLSAVAEAINEALDNDAVKDFDKTGLDAATEESNDTIVAALKDQTNDQVAKDAVNETDISKYLNVMLVSADVDTTEDVVVTAMTFDVTPMAIITVTGSNGQVTLTTEIANDEIDGTVTFLLPVDKSITAETAAVYHEGEFLGNFGIKTDDNSGNKYIEVTTDSFSEFGYITLDETTAGAKIGGTLYATLSDAVSEVTDKDTITLLKNASGTITVSREVKFTVEENGKVNTAEIVAGTGYEVSKIGNTYTVEADEDFPFGNVKLTFRNTTLAPVYVTVGKTVDLTAYEPTKLGYTFTGWYADAGLTKAITEITVTGNVNVYAGWEAKDVCPKDDTCPMAQFKDLKASAWYHDGIHYCLEEGLMNGVGDGKFDPSGTTTRAMIVTLLWRLEGSPVVSGKLTFKDVPANEWYTEAIRWANSIGLVEGYNEKSFGPNDKITREQFATILYRYALSKGENVEARADLSGYTDSGKVSAYAVKAMQWAVAEGLINGRTSDTLVPTGSATRAEAANLIYRFCER